MVVSHPIDFDVTEAEAKTALREFGDDPNTVKVRIVRAAATEEFYEVKEDFTDRSIPSGAFQTSEIVELYDYARDSRESIREGINELIGEVGVLSRVRKSPKDPDTHYFLTDDFQEVLSDTSATSIDTPEPPEEEERVVELPYHEESLPVGPGDHLWLMADGLEVLVPKLANDPGKDLELVYQEVDEDRELSPLSAGVLSLEFGEYDIKLREVIPDLVVYDKSDNTLLMLESVVSEGVFDDERVSDVVEMVSEQIEEADSLDLSFITLFQSEAEYGKYADQIGNNTHVWISSNEDHLRTHQMDAISGTDNILYRHSP